jgi:hypothetical protein
LANPRIATQYETSVPSVVAEDGREHETCVTKTFVIGKRTERSPDGRRNPVEKEDDENDSGGRWRQSAMRE